MAGVRLLYDSFQAQWKYFLFLDGKYTDKRQLMEREISKEFSASLL